MNTGNMSNDEVTAIKNFIDTSNKVFNEIPFPLLRYFTYKDGRNWITITINYQKINSQLKTYNDNERKSKTTG